MSGTPDLIKLGYVIMMDADVQAPNRRQDICNHRDNIARLAISNHHADLTMTIPSYNSFCITNTIHIHLALSKFRER